MRAFLTGPLIRLFPIGLVLIAFQRTVLPDVRPFGVVPQIVLALAVCAGASAGPERGAIAGFTLGLMSDLATSTPLGLTALVYAFAAFVAGYVFSFTTTPPWWLMALFASLGAAIGEFTQPIALALIGQDGWFDSRLFRIVPVAAVSTLLISPLFVPVGRWCLGVKRARWKVIAE